MARGRHKGTCSSGHFLIPAPPKPDFFPFVLQKVWGLPDAGFDSTKTVVEDAGENDGAVNKT